MRAAIFPRSSRATGILPWNDQYVRLAIKPRIRGRAPYITRIVIARAEITGNRAEITGKSA